MRSLTQTQMVISFTISTDRESEIAIILQLIFSLAMLLGHPFRLCLDLVALAGDIYQAVTFVGKVYQIAFISLRWGLGL